MNESSTPLPLPPLLVEVAVVVLPLLPPVVEGALVVLPLQAPEVEVALLLLLPLPLARVSSLDELCSPPLAEWTAAVPVVVLPLLLVLWYSALSQTLVEPFK
jgi:hypothetical protein